MNYTELCTYSNNRYQNEQYKERINIIAIKLEMRQSQRFVKQMHGWSCVYYYHFHFPLSAACIIVNCTYKRTKHNYIHTTLQTCMLI